jgi:ectoine hydroxylase-related dioxygenase (phytanoyl-CoA dioxygenase family)
MKSIQPNKLDWLDHFQEHGYAVVKGAIPAERAKSYQQRAFAWLKSFGTALDIDNPETWTKENLPVQSKINTFSAYGVAHEKFMWDARMEPGVLAAFATLWGTEDLLVSFDALNVTFPNRKDKPRKAPWPHIDQSPLRKGLQCAQGVINLSHSGPEDGGLLVYPGSHLLSEEFFETQTDKKTWQVRDGYDFTEEQVKWFTDRGIKTHKVCAEPGDLLIWDSRTIHWGTEPTEKGNTIRTVIYASYAPAYLASPETLEKKAKVFRAWESTTHWAHDNIVFKKTEAMLDDGTVDPKSRDEPQEKPELSDKLLRLAGAKAY